MIEKEIIEYDLDRDLILKDLSDIREMGFSSRNHEFGNLPGSHSIACPIFDYSGTITAAICILGFSNDLNTDAQSYEVETLKTITMTMSKQLAYRS